MIKKKMNYNKNKGIKGKRKEEKKNYNCTFQNLKGPIDKLHYAFQISKGTMKYLG